MTGASAEQPRQPPRSARTAGDVMRQALSTVKPDDHVAAAAYLLKHGHATALVIVDDEEARRPLGLVTEADIVRAVADGKDVNDVRIRDLMTTRPTVITAATSVRDAAESMLAGHRPWSDRRVRRRWQGPRRCERPARPPPAAALRAARLAPLTPSAPSVTTSRASAPTCSRS